MHKFALCMHAYTYMHINKAYTPTYTSIYSHRRHTDIHMHIQAYKAVKGVNCYTHAYTGIEGIAALHRVLNSYSLYNPEVGYCQSMNFIVGILCEYTYMHSYIHKHIHAYIYT